MSILNDNFGQIYDEALEYTKCIPQFTLSTSNNLVVKLISYGASISSIELPDQEGLSNNIVLGFDNIDGYTKHDYIGSTIGRVCNRIKDGCFSINKEKYKLTINNSNNHLHGGIKGWDKHIWDTYCEPKKVVFSHYSQDGEEGYPGSVLSQVSYSLSEDGSLNIDFQAISTKPTPINMTNHSFFNLAGHGSGRKGLLEHIVQINANKYVEVNDDLIPTGVLKPVTGSAFDMQTASSFSALLDKSPDNGFDHCFCLMQNSKSNSLKHAATFYHPPSGRCLEVFTTEPGVQLYTGNFLPKEPRKMIGRGNTSYEYQGAFCCESMNFPDAVNQKNFPDCILLPGQVYKHSLVYKFTTTMN